MRSHFLLILFSFISHLIFSQTTFQLQFTGKELETGNSLTLEKVQIVNQTKGVDTLLTGGDYIFELVQSLGINDPHQISKNFRLHQASPNPFSGSTNVEVEVFQPVQLDLVLYNSSGIISTHIRQQLIAGLHRFSLNTSRQGLYILKISDGEFTGSVKLIARDEANSGETSITYSGFTEIPFKDQEEINTGGFTFTLGDQLQFIGFAAGFANSTLYDSPDSDTAYIFNFSKPFYRIEGHALQTSQPCFVDVLFSIVDEEYRGVDNLSNNDFRILENNSAVSPTETFRYIRKSNTVPYKLKTVILLDNSASVADKLEQIKSAAISLVNTITDKQEFAIYSFSDSAVLLQDFTNDVELLTDAISGISLGYPSTNLYGAYITAVNKWNNSFSTELIEQGFLVVFTDGDDTQGSFTLEQAVTARGNKKAYMIGLGNELNPDPLNQLANPGPYFSIANIEELEQTFLEIQDDMIRYANSFYWLNYMTPKRLGFHTLKLEIPGNENVFSDSYFEGEFNATGFVPVLSGLYLNTSNNNWYGLDSITIQNQTPYELRAVTYWAYGPPEYTWSSTNTNIVSLTTNPLYFNKAVMNFPGIEGGVAYVTVTDVTNLYGKTLKVTAYTPPVVTTAPVSNVAYTTATCGGNVIGDGGMPVTQKGVCWSLNQNPTISNFKTLDGDSTGSFVSQLTNLTANRTYYIRAYATNSKGTSYGEQFSFTTLAPGAPQVTTGLASNITPTGALLSGEVTNDGGNPVTARGFCWSTEPNPGYDDETVQAGSGVGSFSAAVNSLTPQTTFYVRAYASNSISTVFGNEISFVATTYTPASVTTSNITGIGCDNATGGGNVTNQGNSPVTARGICWSTSPSPTIDDSLTVDGSGTGNFTSQMTNLLPQITYYVRAYATNTSGTSYGVQRTFSTLCTPATVITTNVTNITPTSATAGGNVTNGGNSTVTARGVCWSTSQNPTLNDAHTTETGGIGSFTSLITGLNQLTIYYLRAYATNSTGTTYGNQMTITTFQITLPTVTTASITNVSFTSAICGGNVTDDGWATVTARGVCWSITPNPTIDNNYTTDGTGIGLFTSNITGLAMGTNYYVRAYATNSQGTAYGSQQSFTTLVWQCGDSLTDPRDNKIYGTVQIGTQCWMKQNLNVGTRISGNSNQANNGTVEKYCNNDSENNCDIYGGLYQWNEMMQYSTIPGVQGICPPGWHIPLDDEWSSLTNYLGGESIAGGEMKETGTTHWLPPNTGATNSSGFTGIPGGTRNDPNGFGPLGYEGSWWSSTENLSPYAWHRLVKYQSAEVYKAAFGKVRGRSVRCLKD